MMAPGILTLRRYQEDAIEATLASYSRLAPLKRPAVVLPTGAGKTVIFSHLAKTWNATRDGKIVILVHRDELVNQAVDKLRKAAPMLTAGVVKGARNEIGGDVIVASVQTLAKPARLFPLLDKVGLVIVDECFPAGTKIGGKAIESLKPGDLVPSWNENTGQEESRPVVHTMRKRPSALVRIHLEDGTQFASTPNHPILTDRGWCPAGQLPRGVYIVSFTHDATADRDHVHGVHRPRDLDGETEDRQLPAERAGVLLPDVPGPLGQPKRIGAHGRNKPPARIGAHAGTQSHAVPGDQSQDGCHPAGDRAQAPDTRGEWHPDPRTTAQAGGVPGLAYGGDYHAHGRGDALALQSGHRTPGDESVRGSRWGIPLLDGPPSLRPAEGRAAVLTRVARVQVLEPGRDGTYGGVCPDGYVYNIEVDTTHTYLIGDGVVVHNCHHAAATSYTRVMEEFGCFRDDGTGAVAVGFTATMSRADSRALADVWEEVVYTRDILDMIALGYLCDVKGKLVTIDGMSLEDVKKSRGDYAASSLSDMLQTSGAITAVADAYLEHAKGKSALLFAPTVEAAELFSAAFIERGVSSAVVWGSMPEEERRRTLRRFDDGEIDVLCNCMVLTEGYDSPRAELAIIARPTTSAALYVQMVGRVLRTFPGKDMALVLDVAGASQIHGLATLSDLTTQRVAEIVEGESLREAAERAVREGALDLSGDVSARDVDLFQRSRSVWLQTYAGCWFIPVRDHVFFIWPELTGDTFSVGVRPTRPRPGEGSGRFVQTGLDLSAAMSWAEQDAAEMDDDPRFQAASRDASWRTKRQPPSEGQIGMASGMGLDITGKTKAEVSDMISSHIASSMLDRAFKNAKAKREAAA